MKMNHDLDRFRTEVQPAMKSKLEEFRLLGYEAVREEELWKFLLMKKWRKKQEGMKLFEIVNDIMTVKIGEFMNYSTVEAFKLADFSFGSEEDREALLK